ncbi:MAG TPA: neuraminidase-like domain-containing protein [Pyrinomonadaceae bacterium]|nr:neuraminidase-like domain-containing protein [Pyrinomonadaceae bacterium]
MKTTIKPIALNETSYDVTILHQALRTFGLELSEKEVAARKAGKDTVAKVRQLQKQLNVPVDQSTLVDEATAIAIRESLIARGFVSASKSFTVSGTVRFSNGQLQKRQKLYAFDLDLKGVAVYRTIENVAEIQRSGGFEFLGETVSDNKGAYEITFYDWQYSEAERKKADVVVYAIDGEEIIGRSRIVNSDDYSDKGQVTNLVVSIMRRDPRTEYEILMEVLEPFLRESKTTLGEIAASSDQLIFTAGELDLELAHLKIAASAEQLSAGERRGLSHELLYGIGRQDILLTWQTLYKAPDNELRGAIATSVEARIIRAFSEKEISTFLQHVRSSSEKHVLDDRKEGNTLKAMLSSALPEEKQRVSFLDAVRSFKGNDFREFWREHLLAQPEFKENPKLVSDLLLTQQLFLLSGNNTELVSELKKNRNVAATRDLFNFASDDWIDIVKKTGVPDFVQGENPAEREKQYAKAIEAGLNAAFPTLRIAKMAQDDELAIESSRVAKSVRDFLSANENFDFARSRIQDFEGQIKTPDGDAFPELKDELKKIQRTFQVSPDPETMRVLLKNNLHSAYAIANIPEKSFLRSYGEQLGGESVAFAVHQRASYINTRTEQQAMHFMEHTHGDVPAYVLDGPASMGAMAAIENQIPNYAELFGSPDLCECDQCNSVYSAAAYFVDLLRFLARSAPNDETSVGIRPLAKLTARRPDLVHLLLTCENTNTIIPYIDLVNEIMEYYTANGSLTNFEGYDTGETTAEELRANPQNFDLEAYRTLKDSKYPFTLPYHQPLDVIRTFSDHLRVSRYEALKAVNPQPDAIATRAIEAESLALCEEEYQILTDEDFAGTADATPLHEYFGYTTAGQLESMSGVREFLRRSGIAYTDLVELVKTLFINPFQDRLDFLQRLLSFAEIDADEVYARLEQIEAGTLDPADDPDIVAALNAFNRAFGSNVRPAEFGEWVTENLRAFRQVITLYQPQSSCDLDTTSLRTMESIYEASPTSRVTNATWSKIHRFLRLWRKLGWTIHETDLMLAALAEDDLTPTTISKLEAVSLLKTATNLAPNQLAVFWGNIDTYGKKSLYKKLFLNRAVQQIDEAFKEDAWGKYLQDESLVLGDHQSAIVAAFRITEEELGAILEVTQVIDNGAARPLDPETDVLNIQNLSTIYRYVMLAKGLKIRATELCKLLQLFGASPFSTWDIQAEEFINVSPADTYAFYKLAAATKEAGFKSAVLEYILQGTLPVDSNIGLNHTDTLQTAKDIRAAFAAIEQDHPDAPVSLTSATLTAKLSLTFQPEIVTRFNQIVESTAVFETTTDLNLDVTIPESLAGKFSYIRGSGRLTCIGVMSDDEQSELKALPNSNAGFDAAVDQLYAEPEAFLSDNFDGVFTNLVEAKEVLLDHPAQTPSATLDERLAYVYGHFVPILKTKLRQDAIARYVAALIGLSEAATTLLIAGDIDSLITSLGTAGFSAEYFSDANWLTSARQRTDSTIDFSWGNAAPDPAVPADNFSARWKAYIAPPATGDYTLTVETEQADESFNLYLDDALILAKSAADAATSWEIVTQLNAAQMHLLTLEYAEVVQDAGIRLLWKTATTAREIIPVDYAYPASVLDEFVEQATIFHRAAKFILGFELTETELNHFLNFSADFGNIDFEALDAGDWSRIYDYTALRNAVPQAQALLTDVFMLANTVSPLPTVAELRALLYLATAWDEVNLQFLVDLHFGLVVDDFKNEIALKRLYEVITVVSRSGLSAENVAVWGAIETDFDALSDTAQIMKNAVKAKYEDADWLELAGDLSDKIREHQKNALISYLLTRTEIREWGATDADGLFEYFLIDVQMGACMDTSRIVQANSSVQMFVNRCFLNLESKIEGGLQNGVSPTAIDKGRWEWMKNYRVWEANRKVFLYPENWLEPEWRNDRSQFFKEMESYLVQNDISERSAEQAFRDYLTSLNQVANLEVCGTHRENYDDGGVRSGSLKYLHVIARTHNAPYKFFYRTWNEYRKWSAWEKVQLDIRCVEEGNNSGIHVMPVVWKKRLFLFWPEFIEKQESPSKGSQSVEEAANDNISTMEPKKFWEVRIAWSEYVDGKWMPKQVSKEAVEQWPSEEVAAPKDLLFTVSVSPFDQRLSITISDGFWNVYRGHFTLPDIQSPVITSDTWTILGGSVIITAHWGSGDSVYRYKFLKRTALATLALMSDVYLRRAVTHSLLPVDTFKGLNITLDNPFFFADSDRTYFVRPVPISVTDWVREPETYKPHLPGIVDDSGYYIPVDIPDVGPDDYLPVDLLDPAIETGTAAFYVNVQGESQPMLVGFAGRANEGLAFDAAVGTQRRIAMPRKSMAISNRSTRSMSSGAMLNQDHIGGAFSSYGEASIGILWDVNSRADTGLEFHTFYHPFSSEFVTNLNQGSMPGLMESDTTIASDAGSTFVNAYDPNFTQGFVQRPADFDVGTYYKENVCFWPYGANSLYNWELFFHAPLYIATRLSKNGKYEEAMRWFHYIFDPTTDEMPGPGETEISRYWKVLPFKTTPAESLEEWFRNNLSANPNPNNPENAIIGEWRDNPFDPHLVASNRPLAYMKHVVVKYVENLLAWGDSLFRQDTMESVNEALQIYVMANHILGTRPEFVPKRGEIKAESYDSLSAKWDDFSNALVELENIFPYSSGVSVGRASASTNLLGVGSAFYFCIPSNDKLLGLWDTVADRLFKIRHCQNIEGVERKLALFAPPIDPAALIQAASQGLSLGSILADLSSPPPIYRFSYLIQKVNEFCGEVKGLGSNLLGTLEKKDAEELGRLRASHETQMLQLMTSIRERQVLDAKARKEHLLSSRLTARFRLQHYIDLLGNDSINVPGAPTIAATLTADSQLPPDTVIATVVTDVDDSLVESGESGVKLVPREKEQIDKNDAAKWTTMAAGIADTLAGVFHLFPQLDAEGTPFGVGAGAWWGGQNLGAGASALARAASTAATFLSQEASQAGLLASYIRREQDWTLQANLAAKEIIQLDKQITSADIQIQVAEKELENHLRQIENSAQVELFLKDKFTNQELYQWMKEQLFAVYKQSYNLAYDMAKKAEKAYKYEMGTETASFIQYGYWDNSTQGLVAGEKLQLALRQLEKSYLEENRRELELSKSVSLGMLNPLALIELRETGKCYVSLPEELFDLDFQGHYFRRIKSVSLSIPCVAGPYTAVNCSLRLLGNSVRINTAMNLESNYEHEHDEGFWIDDSRFRSNNVPVTSIATSTAQGDTGVFEFSFRDERYLPFEGSGAISDWQIELTTESEFRQFDYSTISDVILHLKFTARENGGLFKTKAIDYLKRFITNPDDLPDQPLMRGFSMKHEFSTEWHRFLHPAIAGGEQVLGFTPGKESFPFFTHDRDIIVTKLEVLARCSRAGDYTMTLSMTDRDGLVVVSSEVNMPESETYGGLKKGTINTLGAGLNLEELDISRPMTLKLKFNTAGDFGSLATNPDEVEDLFLVFHCKLD